MARFRKRRNRRRKFRTKRIKSYRVSRGGIRL